MRMNLFQPIRSTLLNSIGQTLLFISFLTGLAGLASFFLGALKKDDVLIEVGERSIVTIFFLLTSGTFLLIYLFDFLWAAIVKRKGFAREAYLSIRFEQEAWQCDDYEEYILNREKFSWTKYPLGGE